METDCTSRRLQILVADDDEAVRSSFHAVLDLLGHDVCPAENGDEAIALFHRLKGSLDVIITDIVMPKVDGMELIRHIRQLNHEIPIIAVTGHTDSSYLDELARLEIPVFFKPLNFEEFERLLQRL